MLNLSLKGGVCFFRFVTRFGFLCVVNGALAFPSSCEARRGRPEGQECDMSDVWSEGYFTGVGYTYGYYRETSPVFQRFCLLLRGLEPPSAASAHCELGFGQGVSININAAAN